MSSETRTLRSQKTLWLIHEINRIGIQQFADFKATCLRHRSGMKLILSGVYNYIKLKSFVYFISEIHFNQSEFKPYKMF